MLHLFYVVIGNWLIQDYITNGILSFPECYQFWYFRLFPTYFRFQALSARFSFRTHRSARALLRLIQCNFFTTATHGTATKVCCREVTAVERSNI